ncbi:MAG: ABC transporter ATP-binding protein [Candidatus Omnitrophica bacterium]|nr:ABC transporter ATP-binding protein [Candidatus Omnitrophota bacterium]
MLEIHNVHKSYLSGDKKLHVLKGVNLKAQKGSFNALVGPSGAGKSTLLHIIGGLDSPEEGNVFLDGQDIYKLSETELARLRNLKIGFVFQFYHLLTEFTALENVAMPALITGREKLKDILKQAQILLQQVGLDKRLHHYPSQLSGGERQRCAIARALINKPQLLLCDEPTGNLDSQASKEIILLLKKFHRDYGMTIILVTHNEQIAQKADFIYELRDGILLN